MKFRHFGAALGLLAALTMSVAPAYADNYDVKDGNGVHQSFAAKLVSGILHPFHVMEGMFAGAPMPVSVAADGTVQTHETGTPTFNCGTGCAAGSAWLPDNGSRQSVAPTGTAATTTLTLGLSAGPSVYLKNAGTGAWHYRLGTAGSPPTATTSDDDIQPGNCLAIARGSNDRVSLITDSGTGAAVLVTGTGTPAPSICTDLSKAGVVVGNTAEGSALTDNPLYAGCRATTTSPTARADGQAVGFKCSKTGALVTHPFNIREKMVSSGVVTLSGTTETTLIAAAGAGVFTDPTSIKLCNTSATAVRADIRDATGGTVVDTWYIPAGQCVGQTYSTPVPQATANSAWTAQLSGAVTDVRVVLRGVQ